MINLFKIFLIYLTGKENQLELEITNFTFLHLSLNARVIWARQMISQPVSSIFSSVLWDLVNSRSVHSPPPLPHSRELRTQKLKSHLVRTRSLNVLHLKPGVGPYIAIHATLTARDLFLTYFYPSGPFTCFFSKTSPNFFLCLLWLIPILV